MHCDLLWYALSILWSQRIVSPFVDRIDWILSRKVSVLVVLRGLYGWIQYWMIIKSNFITIALFYKQCHWGLCTCTKNCPSTNLNPQGKQGKTPRKTQKKIHSGRYRRFNSTNISISSNLPFLNMCSVGVAVPGEERKPRVWGKAGLQRREGQISLFPVSSHNHFSFLLYFSF